MDEKTVSHMAVYLKMSPVVPPKLFAPSEDRSMG